jgi:hypothetical protein
MQIFSARMADLCCNDRRPEDEDLEAFMVRFETVGLRLAIRAWILNADLMKKYPGFWDRFVRFLHLSVAVWNPPACVEN